MSWFNCDGGMRVRQSCEPPPSRYRGLAVLGAWMLVAAQVAAWDD
eukprot:COSAG03_NODE_16445_length_401_cov_39.463576_1_plen_44_part_10